MVFLEVIATSPLPAYRTTASSALSTLQQQSLLAGLILETKGYEQTVFVMVNGDQFRAKGTHFIGGINKVFLSPFTLVAVDPPAKSLTFWGVSGKPNLIFQKLKSKDPLPNSSQVSVKHQPKAVKAEDTSVLFSPTRGGCAADPAAHAAAAAAAARQLRRGLEKRCGLRRWVSSYFC